MNLSDMIKRVSMTKAYEFLDRDPDQNIPKLVEWLERLDRDGGIARQLPAVKRFAGDPDSNWFRLARSLWDDVDDSVRKTLFMNLVVNGSLLANPRLAENRKKYGCSIPWTIVLDLSADERALTFDELDSVVEQGKALGTFFYLFSGDPLARKTEVIALCNKHSDCAFLAFTGGDRVDKDLAEELLRVKNLMPAVEVEAGDPGCAYLAMEVLRSWRLLFGAACWHNGGNGEVMGSEAFVDGLVERGAKFACFFPYPPAGPAAGGFPAAEREDLYRRVQMFRETKPLFTLDCWEDSAAVGGCVAGGRGWCRVSSIGDVEPCAFLHRSDSNIREKTLLEAYQSPLFMRFYRERPQVCPVMERRG